MFRRKINANDGVSGVSSPAIHSVSTSGRDAKKSRRQIYQDDPAYLVSLIFEMQQSASARFCTDLAGMIVIFTFTLTAAAPAGAVAGPRSLIQRSRRDHVLGNAPFFLAMITAR
jgi:hypothetical protein